MALRTTPFQRLLAYVPLTLFIATVICPLGRVEGRSMQPCLNPDSNQLSRDVVVVNTFINPSQYRRGDVVSFISPSNPKRTLTKRVIGMPHDLVVPQIHLGRAS
ncbi:hypothetical protein BJ085DRAFT_20231 [Dimargaris cristalligena]|uniref:Peptidase S26 domain-containing protein n=1 Tax=Dimargaris cristalligena TaxID=215637 RepID=A0A4Q0A0B6_9FUNG|nr:hypothetical protein BJ085DRAFT_20231 [Dimargaris cristalligena]|eukprot:RKP38550.1 hypothetical protein BJ085DRAFT_20231 [Dimargaris cristalligena]